MRRTSSLPLIRRPLVAGLCAALLAAACATPETRTPRAYQTESFAIDTPFQYYSDRAPDGACEIGKRALLSQGYQIESFPAGGVRGDTHSIRGEKYFQPAADHLTKLAITLVCLPSSLGAAVYANAMETQFELKSRGTSAGLSVSGFGSLSLPWSGDKDLLVKVGETTISDPTFYHRLFELIRQLDG